jgi:uncharacterized protein with NRDE domain
VCLAIVGFQPSPAVRLLVAANRDEFYGRPARPAAFWEETPTVLGGRDLEKGGSWFGLDTSGRFALLTNYRDPKDVKPGAPSRGLLIQEYLGSKTAPADFVAGLEQRAAVYNGFNLILGDLLEFWWFSNRTGEKRRLGPGLYGLSNALLDTPWPKVTRTKARVAELLQNTDISPERGFEILADSRPAADSELPETGVGLDLERVLSSPFIRCPGYGTRSSTFVLVGADGRVDFIERTFAPADLAATDVRFEFELPR